MRRTKLLLPAAAAVSLVACGALTTSGTADGGRGDAHTVDAVGSGHARDGGHRTGTGYSDGGVTVDAGYYRGDGSFFVDSGAQPDVTLAIDAANRGATDAATSVRPDALAGDASS